MHPGSIVTNAARIFAGLSAIALPAQDTILVEAESFADRGSFRLDTQFIENLGSPYLLAHGLGRSVRAAKTTIELPRTGRYRAFVRILDRVARFGAAGTPGRFRLTIDGRPLATESGRRGRDWHWQCGGAIDIPKHKIELGLVDLTGFDGRCDAIVLTRSETFTPPEDPSILPGWCRELLGLPAEPEVHGG